MSMTELLRRAVARAARLPAAEQNALAAFVLAELDGGAWEAVFRRDDEGDDGERDEEPGQRDGEDQAARRYG